MRYPALLSLVAGAMALLTTACAQMGASTPGSSLALHNVVTGRVVTGTNPLPAKLNRVELPPQFTLVATAPVEAKSASFVVNGQPARVDNQAPFFFTEGADQKPAAWDAGAGEFKVTVKFYAQPDAAGPVVAQVERTFAIANTGIDPTGATMTDAEKDAWLEKNLDTVLQKKTFPASNGLAMAYRLYVPPGYNAAAGVKYPLLVYLHGRGDRGTDNRARTYAGLLFNGRRSIVLPTMQQTFPAIIIVPQCSDKANNEEWARWVGNTPQTPFAGLGRDGSYTMHEQPSDSGKAVLELIDSLKKEYSIDAQRVYLTGVSMGGFGTWEYTARRPELFAAAAPMAGYSDPTKLDRFVKIPFWIFHGAADQSNPVQGSRNMYALLQKAGADVKYTEYPATNHGDTFRKGWSEPDLLPWIFAQRRE